MANLSLSRLHGSSCHNQLPNKITRDSVLENNVKRLELVKEVVFFLCTLIECSSIFQNNQEIIRTLKF